MKGLTLLSVFYESFITARIIRVYSIIEGLILFRMKFSYKNLHTNISGKAKCSSSTKMKQCDPIRPN